MNMVNLARARRIRRTPFSDRVAQAGITRFSVYNHMLLPAVFESLEADYHHLKRHVQVWDVSCERQIEVKGPDANRLLQMLTPRDLTKASIGQCIYIPVVDPNGGMLNDPVGLRLGEDHWWISIADSDLLLWVKGVAAGLNFDVEVDEPDVSPLAVQGPKSDDLMARVFGKEMRDLRFFRFTWVEFQGVQMPVSRSGYSKQGGFEIYLTDSALGPALWDTLMEAGADLEVHPGGPNLIERIEGGLLSYGNDITRDTTPFEAGLGKYCHVDRVFNFFGEAALTREAEEGPSRQIRPVAIGGDPVPECDTPWPLFADGERVGQVTSTTWSPDFQTNVAIAMVEKSHWDAGTRLIVSAPDGDREATVQPSFWK